MSSTIDMTFPIPQTDEATPSFCVDAREIEITDIPFSAIVAGVSYRCQQSKEDTYMLLDELDYRDILDYVELREED